MSDLLTGNAPSGAPGSGRARDGASRPTPSTTGAGAGQARFLTPTQVMAQRTARIAARREQEAARQRMQEEELGRQQTEDVVGVGDPRRPVSGRAPLSAADTQPGNTSGNTGTTARSRVDNVPTTNGGATRVRPTTNPSQPRAAGSQPQQTNEPSYTGEIKRNRTEALEKLSMPAIAGAGARTPQSQPQQQQQPQPQPQAQSQTQPQPQTTNPNPSSTAQPSSRPAFPHAFERWETLSSHWEGLTSYWIHKLEANADELNGRPIDQQMARQVTDLSAAGANLFHAVVELQRLRASSERKFQRWFFETRNEQEQSQERIAELERQLRHERQNGNSSSASVEAVKAEKSKADELVREMRRELSISKEEARRAWEELGRREQEERERTIALRNGEPTLIGGVQVVPMAGMSTRPAGSSSRPQTRGGPIPGSAGPTQMSGQPSQREARETFSRSQTTLESPELEQAQFSYQPGATSPTGTDPFTETSWTQEQQQRQQQHQQAPPLRHEPDTQFYSSPPRSQGQSSNPASARSAVSPTRGQTQSTSPSRFYQQPGTSTSVYQPITATAPTHRPVTAGTERSDNRSYVPSPPSGPGSEDEYHTNPDGSYTRDAQGRRIPSNQPISGPGIDEAEDDGEDDDEDHTADIERERMYAQQYSQRQAAASQASPRGSSSALPANTGTATHRSTTLPVTTYTQASPGSQSYSSTISATSQPMVQIPSRPEYEGSGYGSSGSATGRYDEREEDDIPSNIVTGWENINVTPRHHHPSRLSAIVEERSSHTSPSRMSYISETAPTSQRGGYSNPNNGYNTASAAATRRRISSEQEDNE